MSPGWPVRQLPMAYSSALPQVRTNGGTDVRGRVRRTSASGVLAVETTTAGRVRATTSVEVAEGRLHN
ncbi:STM4014 family protein, partial [Streptomyces sp. NPDC005122]